MRRIAAGLAWFGLTASAGAALGQDGPPPLAPPVTGPVADPAPAFEAPPPSGPGQVLVVPGITTPRASARNPRAPRGNPARPAAAPVPDATRTAEAAVGLPPLLGPNEMPDSRVRNPVGAAGTVADPFGTGGRTSGRPPLTLESEPAGPGDDAATGETTPPIHVPSRRYGPESVPRQFGSPFAPRRPQGLFSRFFPPAGPADRRAGGTGDSVTVEPRPDAEADAALRKRVEGQIRENFGSRLRSYEVRVEGRQVVVRARPARFWQRRALRSGIEALPALRGVRATVEVLD